MIQLRQRSYFLICSFLLIAVLTSCFERKSEPGKPSNTESFPDLTKQLDAVNSLISEDSLNPDLYQRRALIYLEENELNDAFKDITTAIELDSMHSEFYVALADIYLAMGRLPKSVINLEKALQLDNQNTTALLKLAEMSLIARDYRQAIDYIDQAMKIDELNPRCYMLRGVVLLETGDTIRAITNFQKAIDVKQDYFDAHLQLGILYASKQNKLAIDYFNNALNIQPENTDVKYRLAIYHQKTGSYEQAIREYNQLLEIDSAFYPAYFNLGYIHLVFQEKYEPAIDFFNKAIEIKPDYADAYYNRGLAYELLHDAVHSQADYLKTMELNPNHEKAIEGLNRIDEYLHSGPNKQAYP